MTYYAALDVGLHRTAVCIVDGDGNIKLERNLASEVDDLVACLRGIDGEIVAVGLEAGTLTQWLTYGFRDAGLRVVVIFRAAWTLKRYRGSRLFKICWRLCPNQ